MVVVAASAAAAVVVVVVRRRLFSRHIKFEKVMLSLNFSLAAAL